MSKTIEANVRAGLEASKTASLTARRMLDQHPDTGPWCGAAHAATHYRPLRRGERACEPCAPLYEAHLDAVAESRWRARTLPAWMRVALRVALAVGWARMIGRPPTAYRRIGRKVRERRGWD